VPSATSSVRHFEKVQTVQNVQAVQTLKERKEIMDIQRINPREWNCSAAVFGDLVFLSGTVADNKSLPMKGQTEEVLRKIDAVLAKAGTNKSRILSATVYMADAALKDEMNEAWMAWVDRSNLPTRTAVGAVLTPGTLVEITVFAAK
jgi:enamine deaminase RidA (YjgF/YER057c/UK114 family)